MNFKIVNPTKALVLNASDAELDVLCRELTYTNTAVQHEIKRLYNNHWKRSKNPDGWQKELDDLKTELKPTLIFTDGDESYIRPGSLPYISNANFTSEVVYPPMKEIGWLKPLPFTLHPYQEDSVRKLIAAKHGNVELCTGAGKSAIILKLLQKTGLRAAIIAPSNSIYEELHEKILHHFGKERVGSFGAGKKKIGKRFTVCIDDSVSNIKEGTEEWEFFSNLDVLIVDESHTWGAKTLEAICHGIFAKVPYRFFMSGTQTRGDGTEKLLQSIIGETVHTLTTREAVEKGYISKHDFTIVGTRSTNPNYNSSNVLEMKRVHFLNNRNIANFIAKLANASALASDKQTLVLVEELSQIAMLVPLLTVPYAYAHSDSNKARLTEMGLEKVDSMASVEKFNKNEVKVLIGTSCIATGTNIYPTHQVCNWVGGSSEIKTKQGTVGRAVRLHSQNPYKDKCVEKSISKIFDFDVRDIFVMSRQLDDRLEYYNESGAEIKRIDLDAKTKTTGAVR